MNATREIAIQTTRRLQAMGKEAGIRIGAGVIYTPGYSMKKRTDSGYAVPCSAMQCNAVSYCYNGLFAHDAL